MFDVKQRYTSSDCGDPIWHREPDVFGLQRWHKSGFNVQSRLRMIKDIKSGLII